MDTDDLSIPTYNGIIIEAENFNHDLTIQFGLLASNCKDDNNFLNQTEKSIETWLKTDDFEDVIDDIFFGEPVDEIEFKNTLFKILANIQEIRNTPMNEREYEDWD
ncbi:hypothetical protein B0A56_13485 [Flavobacterium columnare NBRC 100251 = ATCC 23463]|nr:hypothetical protein B0A56_13485 [Flavobacterium columnare NBRC 100251 = ATCC 23463]